jgi:hypothetical protein
MLSYPQNAQDTLSTDYADFTDLKQGGLAADSRGWENQEQEAGAGGRWRISDFGLKKERTNSNQQDPTAHCSLA